MVITIPSHQSISNNQTLANLGHSVCRLTAVLRQGREFVDVFTRVLASGHAEAKLKVKTLQQSLPEVVPFDHPEVFDGQVSDRELHAEQAHKQREASSFLRPEVRFANVPTYVAPTCRSRRKAGVNW